MGVLFDNGLFLAVQTVLFSVKNGFFVCRFCQLDTICDTANIAQMMTSTERLLIMVESAKTQLGLLYNSLHALQTIMKMSVKTDWILNCYGPQSVANSALYLRELLLLPRSPHSDVHTILDLGRRQGTTTNNSL